jgi:uncharacterized protein with beta-barrel porin domain
MGMTPAPSCGSIRARLLSGASSLALPAAALVLGVSLASGASAQTTISGTHTSTVDLSNYPSGNPFTFTAGSVVNTLGDAVYGAPTVNGNTVQWTVTNNGVLTGTGTGLLGKGVFLNAGGSVTNQAGGVISGSAYGVVTGTTGTVINAGSITGTIRYGVYLQAGGSVTNKAGGVISGYNGVVSLTTGTVTNAGSITGIGRYGVYLKSGGTVTNQAGGVISGGSKGVYVAGAAGTVTNFGTITGTNQYGVQLGAGGTVINSGTITGMGSLGRGKGVYLNVGGSVTNQAGGVISGYNGVVSGTTGTASTVTNFGSITGTNRYGVYLQAGGSVTNQTGGVISGGTSGVYVKTASGTVINAGSITGTNNYGVYLQAGGSVTNQAGGVISGQIDGVRVLGTTTGTVTNFGTITGTNDSGVYLKSGGSVTNQVGGTIGGNASGVYVTGGAGTVTNFGTITGTGDFGVDLNAGGSVTNQTGGVISGPLNGVRVFGTTPGTVTNAGTITGTILYGVDLESGGSVTNQAGGVISGRTGGVYIRGAGTVTNAGTITGTTRYGVFLGTGGSVTNQAGGVISGSGDGVYVRGTASGTVTNAGTITGGTNSVRFIGTGANVLTLQTGSTLNGTALGSTAGGATNALILQGTGTANNNFVNFNTLDKQASGLWALNSSSTIGATTVDGGTLAIGDAGHAGATLTSPVSVNSGGALAGFGTVIGNVALANGGAVQGGVPGTIGTLNLSGNLTFNSGGILSTAIAPSGTASLVNVAGTAALTGGTVQVTAASPFTHTETFTILTATTISGAFSSASVVGSAFARNPRLSEDAHDVFLTVDAGSFTAVLPASATNNQVNVAKAIDAGLAGGGTLPAGFQALGNLPVTNLPGALAQLSGETATGSQQTTFQAMTQFLGVLLDPFIDGRGGVASSGAGATPFAEENSDASAYAADGKKRSKSERDAYAMFTKAPLAKAYDPRWSVWAAGFGGSQTTDGNAAVGSNTATSRIFGVAAGADYRFSPDTIAGFALAGGGTNFSVANGGSGRSDLFQAGAFVKHTVGQAYISGALAYGWQDVTTDRTVTVAGIDRLRAEFNANTFSGRVEGGYRFVSPWVGGVGITPYAAGQFTTFDLPAYAESALVGSNTFALSYGSQTVTDSRSELGVRTDKSYAIQDAILTLRGRFAWAHDFNPDRNIAATFQALPGASFVVNGAAQAADSALTTASIEMKWRNGWSTAATFEGEFSNVTRSYAGKGVVRYNW